MKKRTLFKALLILFTLLTVMACKEFQEVKVSKVKGFKMSKMSAEGMEGEIILGIKNPNSIGFTIFPSEFDVTFSGVYLGKARLYKRVHIAGNSEKDYAFQLKSSFREVNIMDLTSLLGGRKLGTVEVKGDLKVGKFFRKMRYPVDVKERIDLSK
ncbi:MAG: LEA type 2 family protein [Bacteroidia bacterium]